MVVKLILKTKIDWTTLKIVEILFGVVEGPSKHFFRDGEGGIDIVVSTWVGDCILRGHLTVSGDNFGVIIEDILGPKLRPVKTPQHTRQLSTSKI